jgi:hypothetical protein
VIRIASFQKGSLSSLRSTAVVMWNGTLQMMVQGRPGGGA